VKFIFLSSLLPTRPFSLLSLAVLSSPVRRVVVGGGSGAVAGHLRWRRRRQSHPFIIFLFFLLLLSPSTRFSTQNPQQSLPTA